MRVLISLLIRSHYVYYLRAWHRLGYVVLKTYPFLVDRAGISADLGKLLTICLIHAVALIAKERQHLSI